jgi:hypothetical protein
MTRRLSTSRSGAAVKGTLPQAKNSRARARWQGRIAAWHTAKTEAATAATSASAGLPPRQGMLPAWQALEPSCLFVMIVNTKQTSFRNQKVCVSVRGSPVESGSWRAGERPVRERRPAAQAGPCAGRAALSREAPGARLCGPTSGPRAARSRRSSRCAIARTSILPLCSESAELPRGQAPELAPELVWGAITAAQAYAQPARRARVAARVFSCASGCAVTRHGHGATTACPVTAHPRRRHMEPRVPPRVAPRCGATVGAPHRAPVFAQRWLSGLAFLVLYLQRPPEAAQRREQSRGQ